MPLVVSRSLHAPRVSAKRIIVGTERKCYNGARHEGKSGHLPQRMLWQW